ncbi:MAG: alpha/beta hydrolase [Rubrivivax sp.]|nr:MAG: alpha/beta hydrolase [Rubrivivax sp.]
MKRFVLTLAFLFSSLQVQAADPAPAYPAHTIPNTQLRALAKNADGRSYQLHIHLPGSFAKDAKRRYPVLYVTDGYWDFATIVASYNNLNYDKVVPEFIIVGLGYAGDNLDYGDLRGWELSPVRLGPLAFGTGNADKFIASLEKDIFPLMERDYRAEASQRYLAGSSLGGLFTLHAMYAKPDLFKGYIAASPAVVVGGDWIIGRAKAYAATGKPIKARLYVTGAEHEWPGFLAGIKRYQALLPELKHPELVYQNRTIDGERHAGTKAESYTRGMRFVFEPLAPEKGPSRD